MYQADDETVKNVDAYLTAELLKLSLNDRNAIHEEIHGVASISVPETPELLEVSLRDFQKEIDRLQRDLAKRKVYNMILQRRQEETIKNNNLIRTMQMQQRTPPTSKISSSTASTETITSIYTKNHYAIDDDDFRLRFLRVELFDIPRAVHRFLCYLNLSYEFWGEIVLQRPLQIADIMKNKEQRKYMKKGHHQILPFRDRSGRRVQLDVGPYMPKDPATYTTMLKIMFYVCDASTRDCVDAQRRGVVNVMETHEWAFSGMVPKSYATQLNAVMESIPVRYVVIHFCTPDNPFFRYIRNTIIAYGLDKLAQQFRFVATFGSRQECRYKLRSYGIPTQLYPVTHTEKIKTNNFNQWMKIRQLLEERDLEKRRGTRLQPNDYSEGDEEEAIVETPCLYDICFRQGTSSLDNPGNTFFRNMLMNHLETKGKLKFQPEEEQPPPRSATSRDNLKDNSDTNSISSFSSESQALSDRAGSPSPAPAPTKKKSKKSNTYGDEQDREFCDWLINEIEVNRKGRFLHWDRNLARWVHVRTDNMKGLQKVQQKILISIYNTPKLVSTSKVWRMNRPKVAAQEGNEEEEDRKIKAKDENPAKRNSPTLTADDDADINYSFIERGKEAVSSDGEQMDCFGACTGRSKRRKNNNS